MLLLSLLTENPKLNASACALQSPGSATMGIGVGVGVGVWVGAGVCEGTGVSVGARVGVSVGVAGALQPLKKSAIVAMVTINILWMLIFGSFSG